MTFREMVNGALESYPREQQVRYDRSVSLEDLVAEIPAQYVRFYDSCDHEQGDPKPWDAVFRAHVLRCVKGWKHSTALHTYLKAKPFLTSELGFDDIPHQSTLWRAWEDRLADVQEAVRDAAEVVVDIARYHDIAAPEPEFLPDQPTETVTQSKSKDTLAREKAREVWKGAKPIVEDCFYLDRGQNASVPEGAFWEQHAYLGMRSDLHPNDGAGNFAADSTRQKTPSGDSHRLQTQTLGVERVRTMLQETARTLVSRARSKGKMGREQMAAIDITKGSPWSGEVERDSDGRNVDPWILGYKGNDGPFFQWAVIKLVGHDIPLFLDAVPVHRGYSREDIVDDLLASATGIVPDLDLVMMDREFAPDGVKESCEKHDVHYLNPGVVRSSSDHEHQIAKHASEDTDFDVVEQERLDDGPTRKAVYLPKREWEREDDGDEGSDVTIRQELLEEFEDVGDATPLSEDRDGDSPLSNLLDDMADEEEIEKPARVEAPTVPFETNLPLVDTDPEDDAEMKHQIGRLMSKYKRRWGIENGFKKVKTFLAETQSPDHRFRYFNFAFACVLYNCWRLVDILVQLELYGEVGDKPAVSSNSFITFAKKNYGLDPPD
ncbi:ISNCY family transposase [Halobacterium salinarum]|uniref:ISNCY family transposase n=1 Tax=Halobacterium salinarum TaxID=2242 RepID=UPI001F217159|nr:ISNCY family transposase [Halobacterium salinarum]MCF2165422.1 ISNCY family transposase [Halobacterium salinarum]MCF2168330.1 ISNCY family transposase [Halobacterium salinarum]